MFVDDVEVMCMQCGGSVDDMEVMCMLCVCYVDDMDPYCRVSTCSHIYIGLIPIIPCLQSYCNNTEQYALFHICFTRSKSRLLYHRKRSNHARR